MTFTKISLTAAAILAVSIAAPANAKIATGSNVSDMTVTDSNGQLHNLSDFAGQKVVLEWTNHGCPYVVKHYDTGNMQKTQKLATAGDDAVWLSIVSSAPGKQGYVSGEEANALTTSRNAAPTAVVLDPSGTAGRTFSAKQHRICSSSMKSKHSYIKALLMIIARLVSQALREPKIMSWPR